MPYALASNLRGAVRAFIERYLLGICLGDANVSVTLLLWNVRNTSEVMSVCGGIDGGAGKPWRFLSDSVAY